MSVMSLQKHLDHNTLRKTEVRIELRDPMHIVHFSADVSPERVEAALLEAAKAGNEEPRECYANGTPIFYVTFTRPGAVTPRPGLVAVMETKPMRTSPEDKS